MRWFWFSGNISDTSNLFVNNVVTFPLLYNNKKYGIETSPMYSVGIIDEGFPRYRHNGQRIPVSGGPYTRDYYVRIVGSVNDEDLSDIWGGELGNRTISGKYRFATNITGSVFGGWGIPLNYEVLKSDGTRINGDYIKSPIASNISVNACGIRWGNLEKKQLILMGSEEEVTTANLGSFANAIIDFGNIPQNIPTFLKKWFDSNAQAIYPWTYSVKTQNGVSVLDQITEAPPMTKAAVATIGNLKTLTLTGTNGETYSLQWESETPKGKQFLGLAYDPNATRAALQVQRETPVEWNSSTTLYEVYATYRPPATTFDINLYQNSAEVNRVDKTDYLESVGTLSGVLREECSIMSPSITFKQTAVPTFNYVYIPPFGRYYYVTGITAVSKDIWRMALSCDVLMTWKDDIKALTAVIARQENNYNGMLIDNQLPAQANQRVTVTEFPAGGFGTTDPIAYPFVLTVVGA